MRILVAGATGAIGTRLVPLLVEHGHEVVATTRTPTKADQIRAAKAEPAVVNLLDRDAVMHAVGDAKPEVIIHQATALSAMSTNPRKFDAGFEETNRLRTEGTDHLLAAARAVGSPRLIAQSFAGWPYARTGGPVKTEVDPLDPNPLAAARRTFDAIRHLEAAVIDAGGIVLRYGAFYGPGTSIAPGGMHWRIIRKRQFPIIRPGTGVWSLIHIDDAAGATLAAVERGAPGIYNIVDDEPAPVAEWLPYLASAIGAKPPLRLPAWLGRLAAGELGIALMNEIRGASNAKAKRELDWHLIHPSWRTGFRTL